MRFKNVFGEFLHRTILINSFLKPSFVVILLFGGSFLSAQLPEGFIRERIATGLNPTSMIVAPDGRIFITEKNGTIRIIRDDKLLETPFLNIEVDDSNERGLGHMVLHPQFEQNRYYYVFYTVHGMGYNRVSRYTANGDNTIPGSEFVVINMDPVGGEIHNGGDMVFGVDGNLYIGTGDGGQNWRGEDLGSTNGKVLRIDEWGNPNPENPWYTLNYLRANHVYAYGFRNPFTMTLHPLTGEIYCNDVGGSVYEEVNHVELGRYYGWPHVEGKRTNQIVPLEYKDPVFQYAHSNGYCAIVGSTFYYPQVQQFPEKFLGLYFYSDYCTGKIRMLDTETGLDKGVFLSDGDRIVDIDIAADGSLYYLERKGLGDGSPEDNTGTNEGTLWKVTYTGSGAPFISIQPESALSAIGEDATFSVLVSGASPFSYTWFVDGEHIESEETAKLTLKDVALSQDSTKIHVEIMNDYGSAISEEVLLRVTDNHRPQPEITSPLDGDLYRAGSVIHFSGFAEDAEDGVITDDALSWKIDFHHGTHIHPGLSWTNGISSGDWIVPAIGETSTEVWYRIYLKATDSKGFSKVIYRDVFPLTGNMVVVSSPDSLNIDLDGSPNQTPYEIEGVRGVSRFITAPYKQVRGDSVYFFKQWKDGDTLFNREIMANDQTQTFVGEFEGIANGRGYGLTAYYYENVEFAGDPVVVAIDSVLDNQYIFDPPFPGLEADNFSVRWKGYIQAYKAGMYQFVVIADDGISVIIEGNEIIRNWEPGVHREQGSVYMESGRLYPITIKMYDELYNAQMRFRWSSADFPEEVVPSSQLYPITFIPDPKTAGLISMQVVCGEELMLKTVSYKVLIIDFTVTNSTGISHYYPGVHIPIGENQTTLNIDQLPMGMYYLQGVDYTTGESYVMPFVKVQ